MKAKLSKYHAKRLVQMTQQELVDEFNQLIEDFGYNGGLDLQDPQSEKAREFIFAWAEKEVGT